MRESARSLYDTGYTVRQVATALDVSYGAAHRLLRESGGTLRKRGRRPAAARAADILWSDVRPAPAEPEII